MVDKGRKIFGRLKRHWKDDIVLATGSTMNKDSRGQRKKEDSGRRLLPAVEKHSLKQNRIRQQWPLHNGIIRVI